LTGVAFSWKGQALQQLIQGGVDFLVACRLLFSGHGVPPGTECNAWPVTQKSVQSLPITDLAVSARGAQSESDHHSKPVNKRPLFAAPIRKDGRPDRSLGVQRKKVRDTESQQ
jgi:hypothetical protein